MDILSILSDMSQDDKIEQLQHFVQDLMHRVESLEERLDKQDYYREHNLG